MRLRSEGREGSRAWMGRGVKVINPVRTRRGSGITLSLKAVICEPGW